MRSTLIQYPTDLTCTSRNKISFKTKKNSRKFLLSHVYIGRVVGSPPWWRILLILTRTPHFSSLAGARQTTLVYAACRNFSPLAKCIEIKQIVNRLLEPCRTVKWGNMDGMECWSNLRKKAQKTLKTISITDFKLNLRNHSIKCVASEGKWLELSRYVTSEKRKVKSENKGKTIVISEKWPVKWTDEVKNYQKGY